MTKELNTWHALALHWRNFMKKQIPLMIVGMVVLCGLEAVAIPFHDSQSVVQTWSVQPQQTLDRGDELDQSQLLMNWFGPIGKSSIWSNLYYIVAQGFTPTKNLLTRVEILIGRNNSTTHDITLALHDNLYNTSLASVNIPAAQILAGNFSWVEFDFADIMVTPGQVYYLVASTVNATENWYAWGIQMEDVYPNGTAFWTTNNGVNWTEELSIDAAFKTYGKQATVLDVETTGGFGVTVNTKNIGEIDALNVETQVTVTGGILGLVNISGNVSAETLVPEGILACKLHPLGLGPIIVVATAQADNAVEVTKSVNGFILLFFVIIK